MKKTTDCARRRCVRFNDKQGWDTKFFKIGFPDELWEKFCYSVKYVEQLSRGSSPTVATKKRFQKFQIVLEGLKRKAFHEVYQSLSAEKKQETVKKLVNELFNELAAAVSHGQSRFSLNWHALSFKLGFSFFYDVGIQVGESSARQLDMTVREDVNTQVSNPGQIQDDEVRAAAPNPDFGNTLSDDASLQNVDWNQRDNSQGRPPSRPPVPIKDIVLVMNYLEDYASRFRGRSSNFEWNEEAFRSLVDKLKSVEDVLEDDSNTFLRSRQGEIIVPVPDFSYEDPQNETSMTEGESAIPIAQLTPDTQSGMGVNNSNQIVHNQQELVTLRQQLEEQTILISQLKDQLSLQQQLQAFNQGVPNLGVEMEQSMLQPNCPCWPHGSSFG